jgi:hypothetical protein
MRPSTIADYFWFDSFGFIVMFRRRGVNGEKLASSLAVSHGAEGRRRAYG